MDERRGPAIPRALLLCLAASLAGHAVVLVFVGRSELSGSREAPVDRTLLVRLERFAPEVGPVDERELIKAEPDTPMSEKPEPAPATAAVTEPPTRYTSESRERSSAFNVRPLDLRTFVKSYESNNDQPDSLPFRPDLRRGLEARQAEQRRVARVDQNHAQRFGHSAEIVNAEGAMTKMGDHCYMTSLPAITIQRGLQVSQVECPGKVEWWKRPELDDVATFRGIP